jgi:hypothetical protein
MSPRTILFLIVAFFPFTLASTEPRRGQVVDERGPVVGARVRIKGPRTAALTDAQGGFQLPGEGARVTAWKAGYFIGGAPANDTPLTLRLRALPTEDNPGYAWVDPRPSVEHAQQCGNCHKQIYDEWAGSAHGQSGMNKRFLNLYAGTDWHGKPDIGWNLLKEHPAGASVCSTCHAPSVPFDHPGYEDFQKLDGVHARGVHCDYCHKIAEVNVRNGAEEKPLGLEHGRFGHRLLRPKDGQLFFGPLDDVDGGEDAFAPLYSESRYCASCHEGTVFGTKVYTTYSEWLESPSRKQGKQCQTCHMTPTGKMDNIAPGHGGIKRDPLTLASHRMPSGDLAMLKSCLRLRVKLHRDKDELRVDIETLATNVGHRVPTGFIDRQLLLVVEPLTVKGERVSPRDGPKLPETAGVGDAAKGNFAGLPGRFFARQIEDDRGRKPVPFWVSIREFADTRLVPDQPDRAAWIVPTANVKAVRVRLIYRRFYKATADAKQWPENEVIFVNQTLPVPAEGKTLEWWSE